MKKIISVSLIIGTLLFAVTGCKDSVDTDETTEEFPVGYSAKYQLTYGESFKIGFSKLEGISEVTVILEDSILQTWNNAPKISETSFDITSFGIGVKSLTIKVKDKSGKEFAENQTIRILSDIQPLAQTVKVISLYPHNTEDFTQGLEIVNGLLYEGTGDPNRMGATKVMQKQLKSGEVQKETALDAGYFGEGITILNNKLYQLTWTSQKCFVYDFPSLAKTDLSFSYTGEGWGLTNDGKYLIMSDGSERLYFRDPATFAIKKIIQVYDNAGPIKYLNELEYVDGIVYANVWMSNKIVAIEAETGKVLKSIDCMDLTLKAKGNGDVLNGIAFDHSAKKFYLTGKYWPQLAEVEFSNEQK